MKKNILANVIPATTIGLDLSDRTLQFCELNASGETLEKANSSSIVSRCGATSRPSQAVRELIEEMGHEAVVVNARELQAVTGRSYRTDHHDARQLARLARVDPALLNPVELRRSTEQADLFVIRARAVLVEVRTMLINFARGVTKTLGHRLPVSVTHCFAERRVRGRAELTSYCTASTAASSEGDRRADRRVRSKG
jgi:transposase